MVDRLSVVVENGETRVTIIDGATCETKREITVCDTLHLSTYCIGSEGIKELSKYLPNIQICSLNLFWNHIRDEGVKELSKQLPHTKIQILNLTMNNIGGEGVKELSQCLPNTQINTLDLSSNNIGDNGVKELSKDLPHTKIHTLHLACNNIGDDGVKELSKDLPHTKIHTLNLFGNNIGVEGENILNGILANTQVIYYNYQKTDLHNKCKVILEEKILKPSTLITEERVTTEEYEIILEKPSAMRGVAEEFEDNKYLDVLNYFYARFYFADCLHAAGNKAMTYVWYRSLFDDEYTDIYLTDREYMKKEMLDYFLLHGFFHGVGLLHSREESYSIISKEIKQMYSSMTSEEREKYKADYKILLMQNIYKYKGLCSKGEEITQIMDGDEVKETRVTHWNKDFIETLEPDTLGTFEWVKYLNGLYPDGGIFL